MDIKFTQKQTLAFDLLEKPTIAEMLYGGAKSGGKSAFLCFYALYYAKKVIDICKLEHSQHPKLIGFLGRKRGVDFNKTTLETWKKHVDPSYYVIYEQKKEIVLFDMVKYHFGGLDDEQTINKFNSAEYGLVAIDQAEETTRDDAGMLRGTLGGRAMFNSVPLPTKLLLTANPDECWLQQDFFGNTLSPERVFVQALPSDNTFIDSKKYIAALMEAWKHRPELIEQYVYGKWDSQKSGRFLLRRADCEKAKLIKPVGDADKIIVSCDPAWLGENADEVVIYAVNSLQMLDFKYMQNQDYPAISAECIRIAKKCGAKTIVVDSIGIGAGVVSGIKQLTSEYRVVSFNSSNSCEDEDITFKFLNKRAQMWWKGSEYILKGNFTLLNDEELINQLCAVQYEIKNGRILIEDKKVIKSRLGCSPDRADALMMALSLLSSRNLQLNCSNQRLLRFTYGRAGLPGHSGYG